RHEHAVDLVGPFMDARDARVAVHAFERELARVAVAAEDLYAFVHRPGERLAGPHLVDRALRGEALDRLHRHRAVGAAARRDGTIDVAERAIGHRVADEGADGHPGELLLDQPELGDRFAELAPLLGVA